MSYLYNWSYSYLLFSYMINRWCKRRPRNDNTTFVNSNPERPVQEVYETNKNVAQMQSLTNSNHRNIFLTGIWTSSYYQYGRRHGPHDCIISFDSLTMQITGWGWDNIGKFTLAGTYSNETCRMGITKTYQKGTGDKKQNLGHDVIIQLTQSARFREFEGKWYVQTNGEDKFELKFIREREYYEV